MENQKNDEFHRGMVGIFILCVVVVGVFMYVFFNQYDHNTNNVNNININPTSAPPVVVTIAPVSAPTGTPVLTNTPAPTSTMVIIPTSTPGFTKTAGV